MPKPIRHLLFVGIKNAVVALDTKDGTAVWLTQVGGMSLVSVLWDGEELFASSKGEVWKLDPRSGDIVWHNKLKGLGTGHVIMASTRIAAQTGDVEATHATQAAAAAAAAS
ncbi:MAG: PQQ-binding-like beta-propeller repeat protein [Gemmatimonadaceae bacterium]